MRLATFAALIFSTSALVHCAAALLTTRHHASLRTRQDALLSSNGKSCSAFCNLQDKLSHYERVVSNHGEETEDRLDTRTGRLGVPNLSKLADAAADLAEARLEEDVVSTAASTSKRLRRLPPTVAAPGIPRSDLTDEILSRKRGGNWRNQVDRKKLAKLAKILPRRPHPTKKDFDALTSGQGGGAGVKDGYLTWDEVQNLKERIVRARYRDARRKRAQRIWNRASSSSSSQTEDSVSSASSSASSDSELEPIVAAQTVQLPKWGLKRLRSFRQRAQQMESDSSSATISDYDLRGIVSPRFHREPAAKRFRGSSLDVQRADVDSPSVHGSHSPRHSSPSRVERTSSDPPVVDHRRLQPGSTYAAPILVDSPSPPHNPASPAA